MDLTRDRPIPVYYQLKTLLTEEILRGIYGTDGRLPTEHELCERFGLSRTPVTHALTDLAAEGVVLRRRRYGTFVNPHWLARRADSCEVRVPKPREPKMIGLVGDEIASGPLAGGLIAGAQAAASDRGHALVIMNTGREGEVDVDLSALHDRHADAIVFATVMTRPVSLGDVSDRDVVLLNCFDTRQPHLPVVLPDDRRGGATATNLAIERGHRRIALIGGVAGTWPAEERLAGYREALAAHGIPFDPALVRHGNWNAGSGHEQARVVLALPDPPTALLCGNDRMALGAYDAVKEQGLWIPEDVSVIGWDNQHEIVQYMRPPLTTIGLSYYEMGAQAVAVLDGGRATRTLMPCDPILRGSLAAPPR